MKKYIITCTLIIIQTFIVIIASFFIAYVYAKDTIPNETVVNGINISNMSLDDAKAKILANFRDFVLKAEEKSLHISFEDIVLSYDIDSDMAGIVNSKSSNVFIDMYNRFKKSSTDIDINITVDEEKLKNILQDFSMEINIEAKDAEFDISNKIITPEVIGKELDIDSTYDLIVENIGKNLDLTAVIKENTPLITAKDFDGLDNLVVEFSVKTPYFSIDEQNFILPPEEVLLKDLLEKNSDYLASCVYNAAVMSDFDIIERQALKTAPNFITPGLEAGFDTLKIKPKTVSLINITSVQSTIFVKIFSASPEAYIRLETADKVNIPAKSISQNSDIIDRGKSIVVTQPIDGFSVDTYKVYYDNDGEIKREKLSASIYEAQDGITVYGTRTPPVVNRPVSTPRPTQAPTPVSTPTPTPVEVEPDTLETPSPDFEKGADELEAEE